MELLCPAGNLPSLKKAIEQGADAVYVGLNNDTNARHFAGLNLNQSQLREAANFCHQHQKKLHVAINTFAHPGQFPRWQHAIEEAIQAGVDVLIVADIAALDYLANNHPQQEIHLSVQASVTNVSALSFYQQFGIKRVVLPRVLSIQQVRQLAAATTIELELFAFGSLCIMAEGRCYLSSYLTGESPNTVGACSPAKHVRWQQQGDVLQSRLNGVLIDQFNDDEQAGYPTLCKGRFKVNGDTYHALEEPTSLNTLAMIPELLAMNIASVKIEGRQRSPAYVEQVTQVWRNAIDMAKQHAEFTVKPQWQAALDRVSEGQQTTLGAYHRKWK
ncbi:MAG: U32 family peptidase [Pseudoalteromonas sp.]|uniref:ubiquinone anaerobic biosynthesis protein UbiU n=1 Tax=Pseudoalteromonas sp. TaxID=53249 RepID=UPI000C5235BE|nr:peptidase U32 family protein [Pseudoalteromonas sp.]MAB62054.1 protease [Pseudoalteromonas sp.]NRA81057.1 U32 family peptidase [Pseudoalteromonas sp.]